jgi:hypothetical protein
LLFSSSDHRVINSHAWCADVVFIPFIRKNVLVYSSFIPPTIIRHPFSIVHSPFLHPCEYPESIHSYSFPDLLARFPDFFS